MSHPISWDDMRLFLAVLEEGSLSAAARRLGLSQPTVRQRLGELETSLGTRLFTRSSRGLRPTPEASALQEPARAMAMASARFLRAAAGTGGVSGVVRLSVPDMIGIEVMPPILAELRRDHPELRIEMQTSNTAADLLEQEADIALRTFAPRQAALVARQLGAIPLAFFAAPSYLARRGRPRTGADLWNHDLIGPDRNPADLRMVETLIQGLAPSLGPPRFSLKCDNHPAQVAAARAGAGIVAMQVPTGDADPRLARVLPGQELARLPFWAVTHEDLRPLPRIRVVFDALVTGMAAHTRPLNERPGPVS